MVLDSGVSNLLLSFTCRHNPVQQRVLEPSVEGKPPDVPQTGISQLRPEGRQERDQRGNLFRRKGTGDEVDEMRTGPSTCCSSSSSARASHDIT